MPTRFNELPVRYKNFVNCNINNCIEGVFACILIYLQP